MSNQEQHGSVLEAEQTRVKPPPMYKVVLLNDDYTPMDFVVDRAANCLQHEPRKGHAGDAPGSSRRHGRLRRLPAGSRDDQGRAGAIRRKHQHPLQCVRNRLAVNPAGGMVSGEAEGST